VFLARSRELQAAQTGELAGGREAVRDATRVQRSVLAEVTEASVAMLGDRATDAYRTQILSTLHAASADEGVADQLRRGRLVREVSGSTGFPEAPSLTLVPDLEPRPRAATPKRPKRAPIDVTPPRPSGEKAELASQRRSELERAALQQTKRRLEAADAEAESAQETAVAAEAVAGETRARVIQLQDDLEAARREARSADDTAARARREATRLARAATKLRSKG
jgi:hypothetical protein